MPDQTVTVTFSPSATPQFTFDNDPVTMTAAGKIILNRAGGSTWTFTGMNISSNGGQLGTPSINPAGTSIQVSDACSLKGSYCYTVTVNYNGVSYTSPDPTIVNDPPSPVPVPPKPPQPKPPK
jgi:hypothetical protein